MSTAPKDRPILAWCDHEADPYHDGDRLTIYAAHAEGLSYAPTGFHIVEWGGGFTDVGEYGVVEASLPDWWFVCGSEFECAANPTQWCDLPEARSRTGAA
ncbi:Phage protein [Devosia sp. H5989]|nr:Phage protein [Devosia sp. H5989]